jgi:hypothetical protein
MARLQEIKIAAAAAATAAAAAVGATAQEAAAAGQAAAEGVGAAGAAAAAEGVGAAGAAAAGADAAVSVRAAAVAQRGKLLAYSLTEILHWLLLRDVSLDLGFCLLFKLRSLLFCSARGVLIRSSTGNCCLCLASLVVSESIHVC